LPQITLKHLAYFAAAAQHGSIQGGAEALHISPAAVSAAVAQLERLVGAPLFIRRHARGLVLNRAGRELAVEARTLLHIVSELEGSRGVQPVLSGRLDVGCIMSLAPYLLPDLMRRFQDEHPEVVVRAHAGDQEMLIEALEEGRLDAVLLYDFDVPSTIRCAPLRAMPLQAVLPADHSLAGRPAVALQELVSEPFILLDLPRSSDYILSAFTELGVAPRIAHRTRSPEMVRALAANALGWGLLNFCPPQAPGLPAVRSVGLTGRLRVPNLAFARPYRARTSRLLDALHLHALASAGELVCAA
jgi:DNA-binding transcriptional LysR family regulator